MCDNNFYAPLEKGGILFCNCRSVGMSVGLSVCRPSLVRSISFDPFTSSIPNLVQGLPSISGWSILIFWSNNRRSMSINSSQPTLFSPLCCLLNIFWPFYLPHLVQWLPLMSRWPSMIFRSHVQRSRSKCCLLNIFWPLHLINTKLGAGVTPMLCTYK